MSELNDRNDEKGKPEPGPGLRYLVVLIVGSIVALTLYLVARKMLAPLMGE